MCRLPKLQDTLYVCSAGYRSRGTRANNCLCPGKPIRSMHTTSVVKSGVCISVFLFSFSEIMSHRVCSSLGTIWQKKLKVLLIMENVLSFLYLSCKDQIRRASEGAVHLTHSYLCFSYSFLGLAASSSLKYCVNKILCQIIGTHASNLECIQAKG